MLKVDALESRLPELHRRYVEAAPFPHLVLDDFCDADKLSALVDQIPNPVDAGIGKSRDYVFAKNKFEKSKFTTLGDRFQEIYDDLLSPRFATVLKAITGNETFVDPGFHGGGIHQGGEHSFLDMHADFNFHPQHPGWFRDTNILIYLNKGWKPEYGGALKLLNRHTGARTEVEPLFNRCVIMQTRDFTIHGYDKINFPPGQFRRSLATYGYYLADAQTVGDARSTVWYPENSGAAKAMLGRFWPALVRIKGRLLGSSTAQNH